MAAIAFDEAGINFDDGTYQFDGELASERAAAVAVVDGGTRPSRPPEFIRRPDPPAEIRVTVRRPTRVFVWVEIETTGPAVHILGAGSLRTDVSVVLPEVPLGALYAATTHVRIADGVAEGQIRKACQTPLTSGFLRPGARDQLDALTTRHDIAVRHSQQLAGRVRDLEQKLDDLEALTLAGLTRGQ